MSSKAFLSVDSLTRLARREAAGGRMQATAFQAHNFQPLSGGPQPTALKRWSLSEW